MRQQRQLLLTENTSPPLRPIDLEELRLLHENHRQRHLQSATCPTLKAKKTVDPAHAQPNTVTTITSDPPSHALKAVFIKSDRLWDNGTNLTYAFMTPAPICLADANRHAKVKKTVLDWQAYANVTFTHVENVESATIRITFDPEKGSWSVVGQDVFSIKSGRPTMNLGWLSGDDDVASPIERGIILHEFGHTLGLMHEHQSPVRGSKITLKKDSGALHFFMKEQKWTKEDVEKQIFNVYNTQDLSSCSELDTRSIMMYEMPASVNEQGIAIPPNNKLSAIDKAFMTINYPHVNLNGADSDDKFYQDFVSSLDVTGLNGGQKDVIIGHYRKQNWTELRHEFTQFCTEMHFAPKAHSRLDGTC